MKIIQTYNNFISEGFLKKKEVDSDLITKKSYKTILELVKEIFNETSVEEVKYAHYFNNLVISFNININFDITENEKITIHVYNDSVKFYNLQNKTITVYKLSELKEELKKLKKYLYYDFYKDTLKNYTYKTKSREFAKRKILKYVFYYKEYYKEYNDMILYVCQHNTDFLNEINDIKQYLTKETLDKLEALKNAKNFDLI